MTHSERSAPTIVWPLALATAAVVGSLVAACIMPFIGLAVVAAATMRRGQAMIAVTGAWAVNQIVGYGLLGYPTDANTIAWGVALGVGSIASLVAAEAVLRGKLSPARFVAAFAAGFVANQVLLYAFALVAGGTYNFTLAIEGQLLLVNGVAVALLMAFAAVLGRAAPRVFAAPQFV